MLVISCLSRSGDRQRKKGRDQLEMSILLMCCLIAVTLSQLHPVSLMHKNPQRRKIIHGMCPVGCIDRFVDLKMCIVEIYHSCDFCGSFYGCCLTMHISFTLCYTVKKKEYI